MAVSATRFNYLDKETNVGTKDFTQLNDNAVYNTMDEIINSAISDTQGNNSLLASMQTNLTDLTDMLQSDEITSSLTEALDSAMEAISNMELPGVVQEIFDSIKNLDFQGLKDFFKDLLHVGAKFLCNNLDFLKLFMLGYALNKNIISGLLIALLLSWLDRFCKGFTQDEVKKSSNRGMMDAMFPPKGVFVSNDNAFSLFTQYYSDYLKSNTSQTPTIALSEQDFISQVTSGNIDDSITNLRNSEISHTQRNQYLTAINNNLSLFGVNSSEYTNLLKAQGRLKTTPLVSITRRNNATQYGNLSDKFGSYIKNLQSTSLNPLSINSLSSIEKTLYDKMVSMKSTASQSGINSIPNNAMSGFNFNSVLPELSTDETNYLRTLKTNSDAHRLYDLHPTSEVFLEGVYRA